MAMKKMSISFTMLKRTKTMIQSTVRMIKMIMMTLKKKMMMMMMRKKVELKINLFFFVKKLFKNLSSKNKCQKRKRSKNNLTF
jgi:hypothetical protein